MEGIIKVDSLGENSTTILFLSKNQINYQDLSAENVSQIILDVYDSNNDQVDVLMIHEGNRILKKIYDHSRYSWLDTLHCSYQRKIKNSYLQENSLIVNEVLTQLKQLDTKSPLYKSLFRMKILDGVLKHYHLTQLKNEKEAYLHHATHKALLEIDKSFYKYTRFDFILCYEHLFEDVNVLKQLFVFHLPKYKVKYILSKEYLHQKILCQKYNRQKPLIYILHIMIMVNMCIVTLYFYYYLQQKV